MSAGRSQRHPWWLAGAVFAAGLVYGRRTQGYDQIDEGLRSPLLWMRTPSIGALTLPLWRAAMGRATPCVEGVTLEARRIASEDGARIGVFIYRPHALRERGPVLFYIHGGGTIMGSAAAYHTIVSGYARDLGIMVVSVDYRLAPEHPFPTPLDDVHAAYLWLRDSASALAVDADRIAVGGDSAGAGLAAALCQRIRDVGEGAPVFQLLVYPMLDDRTTLRRPPHHRGQLLWTAASNLFAWTSYLGRAPVAEGAPAYAAPARCPDLSGLPPAWIGIGTLDLFYDEDVDYARRLRSAGVACEIEIVKGAYHAFNIRQTRPARAFNDRMIDAVRKGLGLLENPSAAK